MVKKKKCLNCKKIKPLNEFKPHKKTKDGLSLYCKICDKKFDDDHKAWRESMKNELDEIKKHKKSNTNLITLGYVNNMNELLYISDVAISKAPAKDDRSRPAFCTPIVINT